MKEDLSANELQPALEEFKKSVDAWSSLESERALVKARASQWARRGTPRIWSRWPVLAAAVLVLAVAPLYKLWEGAIGRQRALQAQADAQLMEQVDHEVSESVPTPMQPLTQLVSWDSSSEKGDVR
jgi:hypothetical protein